ncbi:MAG: RNA methyltransferase [Caldilineaceae bacterium]|nr:RNA methyltransferase [Caldilineaceae bacterium]
MAETPNTPYPIPSPQYPLSPFLPPMSWQICQCNDPTCAFRFPAETEDERRRRCPLCGSPTDCTPIPLAKEAESHSQSTPFEPQLHLLLDNLRSSYNVGSLFRTADGAGVGQIHLCGITPTPAQPKVMKTALGAGASLPWRYHRNALHAADWLHDQGFALWALEIHPDAISIVDAPVAGPLALIIGNEVTGVDPELLARCERVVEIPMLGRKRCLNVASAAAIALYWLRFRSLGS